MDSIEKLNEKHYPEEEDDSTRCWGDCPTFTVPIDEEGLGDLLNFALFAALLAPE
jgi:hypothetical protein